MFWNRHKKGEAVLDLIHEGNPRPLKKYLAKTRGAACAKGGDGDPVLFAAIASGNRELVRILLSAGADPNSRNRAGESALLWSLTPRSKEIAPLLLAQGADPNRAGGNRTSLLHVAAYRGYVELVKLLIQAGAKVDCANGDGVTPLTVAVVGNHAPVVRFLLGNSVGPGAHLVPSIYNALRQTALAHSHSAVLEILDEFAPRDTVGSKSVEEGARGKGRSREACQVYRGVDAGAPDFAAGIALSDVAAECMKHIACEYGPHVENQRIYSTAGHDRAGNLLVAFEGLAVSCGATRQYGQAVADSQGIAKPYRYADLNHIFACCSGNPKACPFYVMAKAREAELEGHRRRASRALASPG